MLYDLIKTQRGKDEVVMTDVLPKVRKRMLALKESQKRLQIKYNIVPTESVEKFKKKPHDPHISGDSRDYPRRIRKD